MFHFANLLFSGSCNARCPFCIGHQIDPQRTPPNLDDFPPRGLQDFLDRVREHKIPEVVLTGANTDPLLYRPLARLLDELRAGLPAGTKLGLHTNGRLALRKMDCVKHFDKLCLSLPSFDPGVYQAVMGVPGPPNVEEILLQAGLPVKLSCVVVDANRPHLEEYLRRCQTVGVRRVVLRKLFGEWRAWRELLPAGWEHPLRVQHGCDVFERGGMEVTLWDFERADVKSINLFSSGEIRLEYHLVQSGLTNSS